MAWEGMQPVLIGHLVASGDLSAAQYKFVKMTSATAVVVCTAATDRPIGVLQNKPTNGQLATIVAVGVTKLQADASLAFDVAIGTSADGQADAKVAGTDTTEYTVGRVIEGASNAGEIITALINCANPARSA